MRQRELLDWLGGLHRVTAQVLTGALLLYAVTGAVLTTRAPTAGGEEPGWEVERFQLDVPQEPDSEAAALALARELAPRARVDRVQTDASGSRVLMRRPGRHIAVTVRAGAGQAEIEVRVPDLAARAGELHGQRKYRGGAGFVLWAALADATAVALLLFATSGVLLAWRTHPRRTAWLFLGASAFTLTAVVHLWLQP